MGPLEWEAKHQARIDKYAKEVEAIFNQAVNEAAKIGQSIDAADLFSKPFEFNDYPMTKARIDKLMNHMNTNIQTTVVNGVKAEWENSNLKNDQLAMQVLGLTKGDIEAGKASHYFNNNASALQAFLQRKDYGLNLSDRVWKYTSDFKKEIELGLDAGIRAGLPAAEMARDLKQYLKYPDKLFRRVRDQHGNLQISKNASKFHPGTGVYRSSYKNAMRLTRTETNMAYRAADHERHKQWDFVVGIEVRLSNNPGHITDICDDLKGKYPKDFKFVGWHPHCMCHTVTILKTQAEIDADVKKIMNGEPTDGASQNAVHGMPDNFKEWAKTNELRIATAKNMPYFIKDNFSGNDVNKWFVGAKEIPTIGTPKAAPITKPATPPAPIQKTPEQSFMDEFSAIKNAKTTPEQMLATKETQAKLLDFDGTKETAQMMAENNLAKSANFKHNTYYRYEGAGEGYAGMGNGLYLGRDQKVLDNFYNGYGEEGRVLSTFKGEPKWLDIMDPRREKAWNEFLAKKGINPLNSNALGDIVQALGYDGIKYYDAMATGEEYVLFNTKALVKVEAKATAATEIKMVTPTKSIFKEWRSKYDWTNPTDDEIIQAIAEANEERARANIIIAKAKQYNLNPADVATLEKVAAEETVTKEALSFRINALEKEVAKFEKTKNIIQKTATVKQEVSAASPIKLVEINETSIKKYQAKFEGSGWNETYDKAKAALIEANAARMEGAKLLERATELGITDSMAVKELLAVAERIDMSPNVIESANRRLNKEINKELKRLKEEARAAKAATKAAAKEVAPIASKFETIEQFYNLAEINEIAKLEAAIPDIKEVQSLWNDGEHIAALNRLNARKKELSYKYHKQLKEIIRDTDVDDKTYKELFTRATTQYSYKGADLIDRMNALGKLTGLTKKEMSYVSRYTTNDYMALNSELRSGKLSVATKEYRDITDRVLGKLPRFEGTVKRQTRIPAEILDGLMDNINKGKAATFSDTAFLSTTYTNETLTGNCYLVIKSKTGAIVDDISHHRSEREVLFKSNTKFKVKSIKKTKGTWDKYYIELEEI